jgi:hypothetical protein
MRDDRLITLALLLGASATFSPVRAEPSPIPPLRVTAPFATALPWILPEGGWEADARAEWIGHETTPFENLGAGPLDRSRALVLGGAARGLGDRVEASIGFGYQGSFGDRGSGHAQPTDARLAFAYAVDGGADTAIATTVRFLAKAPTAPDRNGSGTDEADMGFSITSGARTGHSGIFGSGGLLLLGNPLRHGSQDDVAIYGLAGWLGSERGIQATFEIEGQSFSRFHNDASFLHVGARRIYGRTSGRTLAGHLSILRGLNTDASRWGLSVGLSWLGPGHR